MRWPRRRTGCLGHLQHVENAGVHSGDATLVLPSVPTSKPCAGSKITRELPNLWNRTIRIQFIAKGNEVKVIELTSGRHAASFVSRS
jgi:hypothetical protein